MKLPNITVQFDGLFDEKYTNAFNYVMEEYTNRCYFNLELVYVDDTPYIQTINVTNCNIGLQLHDILGKMKSYLLVFALNIPRYKIVFENSVLASDM